jgi:polyisoprenoid-binding protein YceI
MSDLSGTTARRLAMLTAVVALAAVAHPPAVQAAQYRCDDSQSVFAVLTHKAGIAAGLAHDHLIVAPKPAIQLEFDPARPEATSFSFSVAVAALEVDAPAPRAAWKGRLHELGAHSGELPLVSDSDRAKVRAAMLSESQLAGALHPEIRAEFSRLERGAGKESSTWSVPLRLSIRGKSVERSLPVTWKEESGVLTAEVLGEFRFSEFGIEPYSTMLGAIRNDDLFHLFVRVVARPAP